MTRAVNLTGHKYGRLTVLGRAHGAYWSCQCDCGAKRIVHRDGLRSGNSQSCGCQRAESLRKHGYSNTRTHNIWMGMHKRCSNPDAVGYAYYGGRGIRVCDRWRVFENFLADMGEAPAGLTIDRHPNKDGNYEPGNCRWATQREQNRNTRANLMVTRDGEARCLSEWCDRLQLKYDTVHSRISRLGWSPEEALR